MYVRTIRHWNEPAFTNGQRNRPTFLQINIYGTSLEERSGSNDLNNVMYIERALHQKLNGI